MVVAWLKFKTKVTSANSLLIFKYFLFYFYDEEEYIFCAL